MHASFINSWNVHACMEEAAVIRGRESDREICTRRAKEELECGSASKQARLLSNILQEQMHAIQNIN